MSYFKYYFNTSDLKLSLGAEKLLNIFRDRYELSAKKGFTGKNGNVVFLIKLDEIASLLGKSKITAFRMVDELREKGLIFTQKRQSGILEFSLNTNFNIIKNDNMDIIKNDNMDIIKNDNFHIIKNDNCYTYKPNQQARLTKPNARVGTRERAEQNVGQNVGDEILKNPQSENSQSEILENSAQKIQPAENSQPSKKTSKAKKEFLSLADKPEFISSECWNDFVEYKKQRNERYADIGKEKFLAHLANIQAKTARCEEALNETMANNWQGVFEPKLRTKRTSINPNQITNVLMDWISDDEAIVAECVETPALPSSRKEA